MAIEAPFPDYMQNNKLEALLSAPAPWLAMVPLDIIWMVPKFRMLSPEGPP